MVDASQLFKDDEQEPLGNGYVPESNEVSKASGKDNDRSKTLNADGLAAAESSFVDNASSLFNPAGGLSRYAKVGKLLMQNRRKAAAGGGIVGLIIGGFFLVFMALIPLKIENIVQNLQKRFFASSESAIQSETQTLFETYMVKKVMPGYKRCGIVVTSSCKASGITAGTNPVSSLYRSWSDSKLETKLSSRYGIEFSYDKSGVWHLKAPGTSSIDLGSNPSVAGLDNEFKKSDRASMRAAIKDAVSSETKWKQVFYRYKVGQLLEQKYGIKRCIVFCGTKDALADFKSSKKNAAKIYLVQRVLTPLNTARGTVLTCILDPGCEPLKSEPVTSQGVNNGELNGSPETSTDSGIRKSLEELAGKYGITDAETIKKMVDEYTKVSEKGFQKYAIAAVLEKVGLSEVSSQLADAAPVVGWINFGSTLIASADKIGPAIKKISYASNAAAAVSIYMTYRTYADEIHTGNVDPTEVGSFINTLSDGVSANTTDSQVGGTAAAEETPLYGYLMGSNSINTPTTVSSIAYPRAYAASSTPINSNYKCADTNQVPSGKLVCSEEILGQGSAAADNVHSFFALPGISIIRDVATAIHGFTSGISTIIGKAFSLLPGFNTITGLINNALGPVISKVVTVLIPSPFSSNMSGGRTFDMMAAGADVAGNDVSHTTIGGKKLSSAEVASIVNEQTSSTKQSFLNKSFFARTFDTSSPYSLVSRVAMAVPLSFQKNIGNTFASLISSPFSSLFHGFGSVFTNINASAAASAGDDPFKIVQYGYTSSDLANIGDPETYWDANCTNDAAKGYQKDNSWNIAAQNIDNVDPNTGSFVNKGTNPCLLIKTVVGSAGAVFDTSLLSSGGL